MKTVLAFDYGASNGRAMACGFDGKKISLRQVHRFENQPVYLRGTLYWDFPRLFLEMGLGLCAAQAQGGFDSVGIDTWGLDYGLLGADGALLENPVHYRDERCAGMMERAFTRMPRRTIYERTGIQFMRINTLYQLLSLAQNRPEMLARAKTLLFMPDLFGYFLTGQKTWEYSMASTSQFIEAKTRNWDSELLGAMGLSQDMFGEITMPGSKLGMLQRDACGEGELPCVPIYTVAGHDTGSAVAAVPAKEKDFVYISSGTWSLMGTECDAPVISESAYRYNFTNEGGVGCSIRLLKNIMGLWLIQQCRAQWIREGQELSYDQIDALVEHSPPFVSLVDPDLDDFISPGDMPGRIRAVCARTGQPVPDSVGAVARCVYESLALKYRQVYGQLSELTGKKYNRIYIVGGGMKNVMLNRMTADATGAQVLAGPAEATVLGNAAVQLMAAGELSGLSQAREMINKSFESATYTPSGNMGLWDDAFQQFEQLTKMRSEG